MTGGGAARGGRLILRRVAVTLAAVAIVVAAGTVAGVEVTTHQSPSKLTVAQVVTKVRPSIVTVRAANFRDGVLEAAGFFFGGRGHVLTSARVLAHATHVDVVGPTGAATPAALVGIDRSRDVAELATLDNKPPSLVAATGHLDVGTRLLVVGNVYSQLPYTVRQGVVLGSGGQLAVKTQTFSDLIETDLVVSPANLGGAIVNMSGDLVGMVEPGDTGRAYVVPLVQFGSLVRAWTATDAAIRIGPPLVSKDASSLVLSEVSLGGVRPITKEAWGNQGIHAVFERPANYVYGSVDVDIYIDVYADETSAHAAYAGNMSNSTTKYGFTVVGTTTSDYGDEAAALQKIVPEEVAYNLIWRDRNVSVDMYLAGGTQLSPDVSMANLIALGNDQEALIAANLAGWSN